MVASRELGRLRAWCHQKMFLVPLLCRGVIHALVTRERRTPTLFASSSVVMLYSVLVCVTGWMRTALIDT